MTHRAPFLSFLSLAIVVGLGVARLCAEQPSIVSVEGQPLAANAMRLVESLDFLGAPLPQESLQRLRHAAKAHDAKSLQRIIDAQAMFVVSLDDAMRLRVERGPAAALLQQAGFTPAIVKVINPAGVKQPLRIDSPQAGPVYAGVAELSMKRQRQEPLRENENTRQDDRFLQVEMFTSPPLKNRLSGLEVEYSLALIYSSSAGQREATIAFDLGGHENTDARGETKVNFDVKPALPVALRIADDDGSPTVARLLIRDATNGFILRKQSGWRPICSFSRTSIAAMKKPCCCRPASSQ